MTLRHCLATCEESGRIGSFVRAAGLAKGQFVGTYFTIDRRES